MSKGDFLEDLLSSDSSEPANKGILLLLRTETKSGFKAVNSRLDRIEGEVQIMKSDIGEMKGQIKELQGSVASLQSSVELIARQVAVLVSRS